MHMLHKFQQEKYWPAEHEIEDRAAVDTAALTQQNLPEAEVIITRTQYER